MEIGPDNGANHLIQLLWGNAKPIAPTKSMLMEKQLEAAHKAGLIPIFQDNESTPINEEPIKNG